MFNSTPIHAPIIQPEEELITIALNGLFNQKAANRRGHPDGAAQMTRNTKARAQPPHFENAHA